jgi:hypothetical protein
MIGLLKVKSREPLKKPVFVGGSKESADALMLTPDGI